MNNTLTNSSLYELDSMFLSLSSPVASGIRTFSFCLSLPLNIYLIILLIRSGELDGSAFFKLNQSVTEIVFVLQTPLYILCFVNTRSLCFPQITTFLTTICLNNRFIFQCCLCFERYLAVVHPVTFLKYKSTKYHLAIALFIWALSLMFAIASAVHYLFFPYSVCILLFILFLKVYLFFFFSILRVLRRPGPGEKTKKDNVVSPVKKKALIFVSFSLLAFFIQFTPTISAFIIKSMVPSNVFNLAFIIPININNFTGILQPMLFLYQMGKVSCAACKCRQRAPH